MNKEYTRQKYPTYDFSKLKDETSYKCNGSHCSCKFLNDRSQYDQTQYLQFQGKNNINYEQNMFKSFKNKK